MSRKLRKRFCESTTATPTPLLLMAPEDFGEDRNPLTGELVEDPELLQRRPIAVKISNSPAEFVRPQAGLSQEGGEANRAKTKGPTAMAFMSLPCPFDGCQECVGRPVTEVETKEVTQTVGTTLRQHCGMVC